MNPSENKAPIVAPKLDKPGAGVPFFQKLALRWYVGPFMAARADWGQIDEAFQKLCAKLLKAVEGLSAERLETRVLVPPQKGLEDSSRFWSVAMALEHLTLVGNHMKTIIIELSNGRVPPGVADTASVKPKGLEGAEASVKAFRAFAETVLGEINAKAGDRESRTKFLHPWFGPFTAKQWHWLLVGHTLVHAKQIKAILNPSTYNARRP